MTLIKLKDRPKRNTWRGKLLKFIGVVVVLVVALYFVVTSEIFLQRVILPQVGKAIKADVTTASAQLSPFRQIILRDLKVNPRGSEPLLAVKEIRLRYSLLSIMRGKIVVEEVTVESPVFTVVEEADGRSNLDELLKLGGSEKKESAPKSSAPPSVNVKLVALNNATVRFTRNHGSGATDVTEVSGLNFSVRDLQNGQSGKLEVAANLVVDQAAQVATAPGALRAKLGGGFTFDLAQDLKPTSVKGNTAFTVEQATGALADLAALAVLLDCEATPTEVKQIALRFTKADAALGEVRVSGPLDLAKLEGKLKLEILSLDRRVLNLAGAASGIDFGPTTINSTTDLELANAGNKISVAGRLNVANFQVTRAGQTSPTLDLRWDYAVAVDRAAESASLIFFNLSGTQNSQLFLQSELPSPLTIAWGKAGGTTAGDGTFNLAVTAWNLADWQAFAGEAVPKGLVNAKLKLASQQNGKQLQLEFDGGVEKFSAKFGSNQVMQAEIRWQARAQATDLKQFKLENCRLEMSRQDQSALLVTATGAFDVAKQESDLQVTAQAMLARVLALAPQPGVTVSAGAVDFTSRIVGKDGNQTVTGQLALTDFTGGQGGLRLVNYGATFDFDVAMKDSTVELRQVSGLVRAGQRVGGRIDVGGKIDLGNQVTGQVAVKLADFNEEGLRPFLESALGGKKLVSVALNTTASVNLGVAGDTGIKADLSVTNFVVSDPINPQPATPLQARVQVDVTVAGPVAEIRQCQLTLTPTARAKNELNLTGKVDSSKPDAITGNLKLSAASLDVTRYYDLMEAKSQPTNTPAKTTKPAPGPQSPPPSGEPEQEPEGMTLPFQNFTFDVDIARFYLREVDIANLQATAKIDGGHVVLQPCQMKVNGAPVSAGVDVDLGVPGFRYAVSFNAQAVPLTPLVNTFVSDRSGQIGGQLIANLDLKGAGVTGASLQTNLTGQFSVLATNLNLSINNVRTPIINAIVNTIIGLPDLIAGLTGKRDAAQMKWADEITARPIDVVLATGGAGGGKVEIKEAQVNSAAFRVETAGEIQLATVLTNSTLQFPVHVALGRPYAAKLGMVNARTPTNAAYILLPDFLTVKGTLGSVKPETSKTGLAVLAGKTVGGIGKETGLALGEAGKSIYGATSGFLKDKFGNSDTNAATATETNSAAEPKKKSGILNIFKREKKE